MTYLYNMCAVQKQGKCFHTNYLYKELDITISVPMDMDVKTKAIFIGAVFLIVSFYHIFWQMIIIPGNVQE